MNTIELIVSVLGWCTVINLCILMAAAMLLNFAQGCVVSIHSKLTHVSADKLPTLYFSYLANYKIAILVFNLVPYLALKLAT